MGLTWVTFLSLKQSPQPEGSWILIWPDLALLPLPQHAALVRVVWARAAPNAPQALEAPQAKPSLRAHTGAAHSKCPSVCCSHCHWLTVLPLSTPRPFPGNFRAIQLMLLSLLTHASLPLPSHSLPRPPRIPLIDLCPEASRRVSPGKVFPGVCQGFGPFPPCLPAEPTPCPVLAPSLCPPQTRTPRTRAA